jgi:hypothetical protein
MSTSCERTTESTLFLSAAGDFVVVEGDGSVEEELLTGEGESSVSILVVFCSCRESSRSWRSSRAWTVDEAERMSWRVERRDWMDLPSVRSVEGVMVDSGPVVVEEDGAAKRGLTGREVLG